MRSDVDSFCVGLRCHQLYSKADLLSTPHYSLEVFALGRRHQSRHRCSAHRSCAMCDLGFHILLLHQGL